MRIISFKGTNMDLTPAIKKYVEEKIEAIEKLCLDFEPAAEVRVEVGKTTTHHSKGPHYRAEMQLSVPGEVLRAEEQDENLYAAIDAVKDQLRRQVKSYKDRLKDRVQRAARPDKE
jgi:putative sigma-54 modulation protein